jgi:putative ABC transport system permease protein
MRQDREFSMGRRIGLAIYKILILLYPRKFRRVYRAQLLEAYSAQRNDPGYGAGMFGRIRFGFDILADTISSATRQRRALRAHGKRAVGPGGVNDPSASRKGVVGMIDSMSGDLRDAIRCVRRSPGFSALVVLILAIGIGANVAMFSVTNAALLKALPFPDSDRLVSGRATFNGRINPSVSIPDYRDYRDRSDVFESLALFRGGSDGHTILGGEVPERASGLRVSVNFFETLGVRPQLGRGFLEEEGEPDGPAVAVLGHGYWQRRFGGSTDVLGSSLPIDGVPNTIVGVMPAGFHLMLDVDFWRPNQREGARGSHSWLIVGRLKAEVSLEQAQSQVDVISIQLQEAYPETNETKALLVTDLQDSLSEGYRVGALLLLGAIGLVLLIACGNIASLLLARGSVRTKELSVRAALGASGRRLARLLFAESFLLAAVACVLGIALAVWLQGVILAFMPLDYLGVEHVGVSAPMLLFAIVLSLGSALLSGGVPALFGSRTNPAQQLNGAVRVSAGGGSTRLRSGLVVLQVALSAILLIGAGLLLRSFASLSDVDVGFETDNLLTAEVRLPAADYADFTSRTLFFAGLLEDIRAIPGVLSASAINKLPIRSPWMDWGVWNPENPPTGSGDSRSAYSRTVLPGYFATMDIPLQAGRDIADGDGQESPRVVVINDVMARTLYPDQNPIGLEVAVNMGAVDPMLMRIVGVVGDARVNMIALEPGFQIYFSDAQMGYTTLSLAIRTQGGPDVVIGPLRSALSNRDSNVPLANIATMEEILSDSVAATRVINVTLAIFSAVALFLAAIGLYGVLAYQVARRLHEIGVRIALGATSSNVVRLVFQKGMLLVALGLGLGLIVALWATRLLEQQLFSIVSTDPATYIGVAVCFVFVGAMACLVPAMRAVRIDPVEAFRGE